MLELDEKPQLAPGRIQVTIHAIPATGVGAGRRTILDVLGGDPGGGAGERVISRPLRRRAMKEDEAERRAGGRLVRRRRWARDLVRRTSANNSPGELGGCWAQI